ncbi:D-inositol 3-phosphate glycosyltransferase [Ferriphaselus amnicola]|uniref:D-inositol 3-phosphate glycosyltransferase n=2 Tax=Ferriphaselus amnicola TaxID=1188319 RepID=A0A2Z6G9U0_9PROT|nr:D-inositol 3-phosphate glycosyltransferase [Ferriphaselus amnicola]
MRPSVLQVNNFHYVRGGSDKYFFDLTRLLLERGHATKTFASQHDQDILNGWKVGDLPHGVNTSEAGGIQNLVHFLYSIEARRKLEAGLSSFAPDIAHLHIYYGQLTSSVLSPLHKRGIPVVQTLHEYKTVCATHGLYSQGRFCDRCHGHAYWHAVIEQCNRGSVPRSALSAIEGYLATAMGDKSKVDRFIAVSEYQRDQLVRLGMPSEKLSVVHHFTQPIAVPPSVVGDYFLYVGRMVKEKGVPVLLRAYASLAQPRPKLVLVGEGIDTGLFKHEVEQAGLKNDVVFTGHQEGLGLTELYRNCLCVINPSLLNETFGLTALEAQAMGRPVIASRIGALPEVVRDNETGMLVEPGSDEALATAMESMRCNSVGIVQMGLAGWTSVKQNFSKAAHYEKINAIYHELL